jgi:DNA-binding transcriptional ArsR family regulator
MTQVALVVADKEGLTPGVPSEQLGISPASMSLHLKELLYAGLVSQTRDGRNLIYRADLSRKLLGEAVVTAQLLAVVIGSGIMAERLSGGNVATALVANAGLLLVIPRAPRAAWRRRACRGS